MNQLYKDMQDRLKHLEAQEQTEEIKWRIAEITLAIVKVQQLLLSSPNRILPNNDAQIKAYGLLQLIAKEEMQESNAYSPENDIRNRNIANWKKEYYTLIGNLS